METIVIVLASLAAFLSVCAFLASAVTAIIVIGWKNSTHRVVQVPSAAERTTYEYDVPPEVAAVAPARTEPITPEDYIRRVREAELEAEFYNE